MRGPPERRRTVCPDFCAGERLPADAQRGREPDGDRLHGTRRTAGGPRGEVNLQEISNAQKQLQSSETEYIKLDNRVTQVSEPQYVIDLKERLIALDEKIRRMGKNKKQMELSQLHREKKINHVMQSGEPEMFRDIQKHKFETTVAEQKLQEVDTGLEKGSSMIQEYTKRLGETNSLYRKLESEAVALDIQVGSINKTKEKPTATGEMCRRLQLVKDSIAKEINLIKTRYSVTLADFSTKKLGLQKKVGEVAEKIQKKNE